MKRVLLAAFVLAAALFVFSSCRKEVIQSENIREIIIDTTLSAGTDYQLQLAPLGDDDNIVDIIQQAQHFSVSRIENLTDVFNPVYHYVPGENASGPEQVVLAVSKNPTSKNYNHDSTIVYLNFLIK
ncbi:MAG: hypothetical protein JO301_05390 [Chitinophagaceae bacterium]|nr:hypothetical protein [Chitinophagaceae bacterium]